MARSGKDEAGSDPRYKKGKDQFCIPVTFFLWNYRSLTHLNEELEPFQHSYVFYLSLYYSVNKESQYKRFLDVFFLFLFSFLNAI